MVERRVISSVNRSSSARGVLSASDGGICVAIGASATPAASNRLYTSGRYCMSRRRQRAITMCGCTICGAAERKAQAAADSRSAAGLSRSCSSTTTSWPARASVSEDSRPEALPPTIATFSAFFIDADRPIRAWRPIGVSPEASLCLGAAGSCIDLHQLDPELRRRVTAHHARQRRLVDARARECLDGFERAGRVVIGVARSPDDLVREVVRQLLYQPFLGVEAEHHVALFPHFLGVGADGIVMQRRDRAGRGLHLLQHFLHP